MAKHLILLAGMSLAVGGMTWVSPVRANDKCECGTGAKHAAHTEYGDKGTTKPSTQALAPDSTDAKHIRSAMAQTVDDALTPHGASNLFNDFSSEDAARLVKGPKVSYDDVDARIAQIRKDWRDKYHQDLVMADRQTAFNDPAVRIYPGEAGENARMAGERLHAGGEVSAGGAHAEAHGNMDHNQGYSENQETQAQQAALRPTASGLTSATVILPATQGEPEVPLRMVPQGNVVSNWRLDIPDNVDNQRLHDNLLRQLNEVADSKDQWPADPNVAYRMVSYHVFRALTDTAAS